VRRKRKRRRCRSEEKEEKEQEGRRGGGGRKKRWIKRRRRRKKSRRGGRGSKKRRRVGVGTSQSDNVSSLLKIPPRSQNVFIFQIVLTNSLCPQYIGHESVSEDDFVQQLNLFKGR